MNDQSHVDRDRPCGTRTDHVPHRWDYGRRQCQGYGKYAADPAPSLPDEPCTVRYVGPTGITWLCVRGRHHDPDPSAGYCGTGHQMRAVQPLRA